MSGSISVLRVVVVALAVLVGGLPPITGMGGREIALAQASASSVGWAWGENTFGQLGDGTVVNRLSPVPVVGVPDLVAVSGGDSHSLGLGTDGTVWGWGWNGYGQLGDGTEVNRSTPVQVTGLTGVVAVSAGREHSLALKADGTVWAWGRNVEGALGDGTTTKRITPVQVSGLSGVTAIAAGSRHSVALKSDGTVWTWGWNGTGQLGNGKTTNSKLPVKVAITGVKAVAAGGSTTGSHTLVVKTDGTVWGWGYNAQGQLGDNTITTRKTPVRASGITSVATVEAGEQHSVALGSDGRVWGWGKNTYGQLGDGTTTQRRIPTLSLMAGASVVVAGDDHTLAIKTVDGSLWGWGINDLGQLGLGTTVNTSTPVQIPTDTPVTFVTGGEDYVLIIVETASDTTPPQVAIVEPSSGEGVSGVVQLRATATDDTVVTEVRFLIDGETVATITEPDTEGLYTASWDSTFGQDTMRGVVARAFDAAGNTADSEPIVIQVFNELDESPVSVFVLSEDVPLSDVEAALREAELQPIAFDHRTPLRGGFYSWEMTLDAAVSLYRSLYQAKHGAEPNVFSFTIKGEATSEQLGDLAPLVAEEETYGQPTTVAVSAPSAATPARIIVVEHDDPTHAAVSSNEAQSTFSSSEVPSSSPDGGVAITASDPGGENWWPDQGTVAGFEDSHVFPFVIPFPGPIVLNVEVPTARVEQTVTWGETSPLGFAEDRAYEHDLVLHNDGRAGTRPACNPLTEPDFWAYRAWVQWDTTWPDEALPYADFEELLLGVDPTILDPCSQAGLQVGVIFPRLIPDDVEHRIEIETLRGFAETSPITVFGQNAPNDCIGLQSRWCIGISAIPSSVQPFIRRADNITVPGCAAWSRFGPNADDYVVDACGVVSEPITFSEYPLGTVVSDQYRDRGVMFGGDAPIITNDSANPTAPVLSGQPVYSGDIAMSFVEPGTATDTSVKGVSFDVGYMDSSPNSVFITSYDIDGNVIQTDTITGFGIVRYELSFDTARVHRVFINVTSAEVAGAAIDNIVMTR